jgi:phage antirepressor YoqD-like protein
MSVATTAVLLIIADDNAVPNNKRKIDFILDPLNNRLDRRRNILVLSKAKEHITNSIKVTSPGLTALVKISSTVTNDKARHTSTVIEKTRSGTRLYFTKLIKVTINTTIINHCSVVIITSLIIKKTRHKQKLLMASVYSGLDKIYEG